MRLLFQIMAALLVVALLPLVVSSVTGFGLAEDAIAETAVENLVTEANHLSELSELTLLDATRDLAQAATLRFDRLRPDELGPALGIIYRNDIHRNVVALIDGTTGEPLTDLVYQEDPDVTPGLFGHVRFNTENYDAFAEHIPLSEAVAAGRAISEPYSDPERGLMLVAMAVRVDGPKPRRGEPPPWVVAVEYSLSDLQSRFMEAGEEGMRAFLVDVDNRVVCHTDKSYAMNRTSMTMHNVVAYLRNQGKNDIRGHFPIRDDDEWLSAFSRVTRMASSQGTWSVVVERRAEDVLGRVDSMRSRTLFWILVALAASTILGFFLSRGIAGPLRALKEMVDRFGNGETDVRSELKSSNEFGALSVAFNKMADAIEDRDLELREFTSQLKTRVEDRTRELKDAQDDLVRAQKSAAVGELGAGIAHELSQPLGTVLTEAQLVLLRSDEADPHYPRVELIEKEARRIQEVIDSLTALSDDDAQGGTVVSLDEAIDDALSAVARPIIAQRIQLKKVFDKNDLKVRGSAEDIQNIVMALLQNAKDAMPDGGVLTISTERIDDRLVCMSVEDSGRGISTQNLERIFDPFFTTRGAEGHKGMGLTLAQKIAEKNGGKLNLESRVGKGTIARVVLPGTMRARSS